MGNIAAIFIFKCAEIFLRANGKLSPFNPFVIGLAWIISMFLYWQLKGLNFPPDSIFIFMMIGGAAAGGIVSFSPIKLLFSLIQTLFFLGFFYWAQNLGLYDLYIWIIQTLGNMPILSSWLRDPVDFLMCTFSFLIFYIPSALIAEFWNQAS